MIIAQNLENFSMMFVAGALLTTFLLKFFNGNLVSFVVFMTFIALVVLGVFISVGRLPEEYMYLPVGIFAGELTVGLGYRIGKYRR